MGTGVALSELLSVSFQPLRLYYVKDQICLTKELSSDGNNNSFVETRLESFSPLHQRVIDFLPTYFIISDNFRKAQVFHLHSLKSGLKNMAKPHDLLVQIS